MAQDKLIKDLLGKTGFEKLSKSVTGTDLNPYIACRAAAAWFSQVLSAIEPGQASYVEVPGTEGSKLYLEKSEDGHFKGELIKGGKVEYHFARQSQGDWQKELSAVPFTVLAESGVKVDQSYAKEVPAKLNEVIDRLVELQLAKAIQMKEVEGDEQKVEDDQTPGEHGEQEEKRKRNNPRKIQDGMSVAEIDMMEHVEAPPSSKPLKGKISKEEKPLSKPPVSEAQRRAMHAAASGHSTLGIPKTVGKEFSNADKGGKLPQKVKKAGAPQGMGAGKVPQPANPPTNKQMPKSSNPKPAAVRAAAPKMPMQRVGMVSMGMGMGKSEGFRLSEQEVYRPCFHCGTPEFKKSEDGSPRFTPCACFASEGKSIETGKSRKFCNLTKSADGSMKLTFAKNADPEAKRLFLLLLKGTLLSTKMNQD